MAALPLLPALLLLLVEVPNATETQQLAQVQLRPALLTMGTALGAQPYRLMGANTVVLLALAPTRHVVSTAPRASAVL